MFRDLRSEHLQIESFVPGFNRVDFRKRAGLSENEPLYWVKLGGHALRQIGAEEKSTFDIFIATEPGPRDLIGEINREYTFIKFFDLDGKKLKGGLAKATLLQIIG